MPRQRRTRRPRRRFRRRRNNLNRTVSARTGVLGLKDRTFAQLKYNEVVQWNPGAATGNYQFNLNSLFDVNRTGSGHQPYFYDQYSTFYNRYKVHGCKWFVRLSGCNTLCKVTVVPSNSTTAPVDNTDATEMPYAKSTMIAQNTTPIFEKAIKGYVGMKKLYGRKELENKDEALVSASPSETAVLNINAYSADGSTTVSSLNIDITLVYYCEFFDRLNVVGS